jgi:hypothetical protein
MSRENIGMSYMNYLRITKRMNYIKTLLVIMFFLTYNTFFLNIGHEYFKGPLKLLIIYSSQLNRQPLIFSRFAYSSTLAINKEF